MKHICIRQKTEITGFSTEEYVIKSFHFDSSRQAYDEFYSIRDYWRLCTLKNSAEFNYTFKHFYENEGFGPHEGFTLTKSAKYGDFKEKVTVTLEFID